MKAGGGRRALVLLARDAEEVFAALVPRQTDGPIVIVGTVAPAGGDGLDTAARLCFSIMETKQSVFGADIHMTRPRRGRRKERASHPREDCKRSSMPSPLVSMASKTWPFSEEKTSRPSGRQPSPVGMMSGGRGRRTPVKPGRDSTGSPLRAAAGGCGTSGKRSMGTSDS